MYDFGHIDQTNKQHYIGDTCTDMLCSFSDSISFPFSTFIYIRQQYTNEYNIKQCSIIFSTVSKKKKKKEKEKAKRFNDLQMSLHIRLE